MNEQREIVLVTKIMPKWEKPILISGISQAFQKEAPTVTCELQRCGPYGHHNELSFKPITDFEIDLLPEEAEQLTAIINAVTERAKSQIPDEVNNRWEPLNNLY